jgi:hypothetical protein
MQCISLRTFSHTHRDQYSIGKLNCHAVILRKRKRQAAKAAVAAAKAKAVVAKYVINNNDASITDANEVVEKKEVTEDDSFTLVGPRRG